MTILNWNRASIEERKLALCRPEEIFNDEKKSIIQDIFNAVRTMGDSSLLNLTERFDHIKVEQLLVNLKDVEIPKINNADQIAIEKAAKNIRTFHRAQLPRPLKVETMDGVLCEKQWRAIETVGLYIPGGSAPLISTLLMLAIPAQIAGVKNIVLCTPPQKGENLINPHVLWTAKWLGLETLYTLGGAQAIAAMTVGTKTIPKVNKIFGPGNAWVMEAKRFAAGLNNGPAIDMPAGPSEVMVLADQNANPAIVAADLLAQAEHDTMSQTVLISFSDDLISAVKAEINTQLKTLSRAGIARVAMEKAIYILVKSNKEAVDAINQYAPEHLIVNVEHPDNILPLVNNAGSIFVGPYTPESVGDYASGTNHVLPTSGFARSYSGLGTTSFMKSITLQTLTKEGLQTLGPIVERLADLEGLDAHAQAVTKRLALMSEEKKS